MKCPHCDVDLVMSDRQSIEIDYCPKCRGVWLDGGELDKIIERSMPSAPATVPPQNHPQPPLGSHDSHYGQPSSHDSHYGQPYKHRKSWLSELFD